MAYLIIVLTVFDIFICGMLLNLVIATPFCKAYPIICFKSKQVYREQIYKSIRDGDHFYYISIRKFLNTLMNVL